MYGRIAIGILVVAALATAQGKPTIAEQLRGGKANDQLRSDLGLRGTAGPGYIQQDFFKTLRAALKDKFGDKRGEELYQHLLSHNVSAQEVMDLMNGRRLTESKLKRLFGATDAELDRLRMCIEEALRAKDRKIFFGILMQVMIQTGNNDETTLQKAGSAVGAMSEADLQKLARGAVSTGTIGEAFGIKDKGSCKQMQDALLAMRESPLVNHPMCESLGMAKPGGCKPEGFAEPAEGMPGCGDEFKDGMAGGLPFDTKLPPLPYAGENMGFGCKGGATAESAPESSG
ncbi:MAG: hypothetical protein ACHQ1G_05150 [Planctomycetota bacterium]